jgi:hypothetical protein
MSMQFTKRPVSNPFFNGQHRGDSQTRIGAVDNPAGGEVRPSEYIGKSHSVHPTRGIGGDVPMKTRQ